MSHPALAAGNVAIVTGGASGIGLAAASRFAALGLKVAIADRSQKRLAEAAAQLGLLAPGGTADILTVPTDVADTASLLELEKTVRETWGAVHVLMNNAGVQPGSALFGPPEPWAETLAVNLMGAIHGVRIFAPAMITSGEPGLIINTGSKQGITTPPGDPAYNISKAGLKVFTEALEHELRTTPGCRVTAHLLIPGFVFTPLAAHGRAEKPDGAWTADETADFMMDRLAAGDFYILCPDNDVDRRLDERRIAWSAGDIIENRPPLSRWHPDHAEAFKAFAAEPEKQA